MKCVRLAATAATIAANMGTAGAAPPQASSEILPKLNAAFVAYQAGDCSKALTISEPLLPHLAGVPEEVAAIVYEMVARCEWSADKDDEAYSYIVKGTALDSASADLWALRFSFETYKKKYDAAVSTLDQLTKTRRTALKLLRPEQIGVLGQRLHDSTDKVLEARFYRIVIADDFLPSPFWPADRYRYQLAALLKDDGQVEEANALIGQIDEPYMLITAGLDPRFRAISTKTSDIRAATERELARDQERSKAHPDLLEGYLQQVRDLRSLGRDTEALAVLDSTRTRTGQVRQFSDQRDSLNWYWNERGYLLAELGNREEAILSLRRGGVSLEHGNLNVSQVINLASMQVDFGLGADALETLEVFQQSQRPISPYGELEMRAARVCAQSLAGRLSEARDDMEYAKAHELDNAQAAVFVLICGGDNDGAAAILIRTLNDPDRRVTALEELSEFDKLGSKRGDFFDRELAKISARPDVRAAIDAVGGPGRFNVRRS